MDPFPYFVFVTVIWLSMLFQVENTRRRKRSKRRAG